VEECERQAAGFGRRWVLFTASARLVSQSGDKFDPVAGIHGRKFETFIWGGRPITGHGPRECGAHDAGLNVAGYLVRFSRFTFAFVFVASVEVALRLSHTQKKRSGNDTVLSSSMFLQRFFVWSSLHVVVNV
jgi:hypothetical protein